MLVSVELSGRYTVISDGQLIVGGVLSTTVTICVAVELLPATSVAVQVIVVLPTGNVLPDGLRVIVTAEQLSVAVAMPGSTVVSQVVAPEPVYAVTAAGTSVNVGPVESTTVNTTVVVAVLPAPLLLLEPSFAVSVIVCGPNPTNVPTAGLWVMVIGSRPWQLSLLSEPEQAQLSLTVAVAVKSGIAAWQLASAADVCGVPVMVGGSTSFTVIVCVQDELPVRCASSSSELA